MLSEAKRVPFMWLPLSIGAEAGSVTGGVILSFDTPFLDASTLELRRKQPGSGVVPAEVLLHSADARVSDLIWAFLWFELALRGVSSRNPNPEGPKYPIVPELGLVQGDSSIRDS